MSQRRSSGDRTVEHDGDEGTIRSAEYRGRFKVRRGGIVQIIWQEVRSPPRPGSRP